MIQRMCHYPGLNCIVDTATPQRGPLVQFCSQWPNSNSGHLWRQQCSRRSIESRSFCFSCGWSRSQAKVVHKMKTALRRPAGADSCTRGSTVLETPGRTAFTVDSIIMAAQKGGLGVAPVLAWRQTSSSPHHIHSEISTPERGE